MSKYKARITVTVDARDINEAIEKAHESLWLGISPEHIDVERINDEIEASTKKERMKWQND